MGFLDWVKKIVAAAKEDPLDTVEGIRAVPVPNKREESPHEPKEGVAYILQRKATEHKKNGRMDLAIECLKKSNEIIDYYRYDCTRKEYERLYRYLMDARRFDEADAEKKKVEKKYGKGQLPKATQRKYDLQFLKDAKECDTDLVEMSIHHPTCGECAKYQGRVFSISGTSKKFPPLPEIVRKTGKIHEGCRHTFYPFFYRISRPNCGCKDIVAYSNRPFVDERSDQEKEEWAQIEAVAVQEKQDRQEYEWLQRNLPEKAPKSFGGHRKMKNANSANYQKLMEAAKSAGNKG